MRCAPTQTVAVRLPVDLHGRLRQGDRESFSRETKRDRESLVSACVAQAKKGAHKEDFVQSPTKGFQSLLDAYLLQRVFMLPLSVFLSPCLSTCVSARVCPRARVYLCACVSMRQCISTWSRYGVDAQTLGENVAIVHTHTHTHTYSLCLCLSFSLSPTLCWATGHTGAGARRGARRCREAYCTRGQGSVRAHKRNAGRL